jgi:hypothetical protein
MGGGDDFRAAVARRDTASARRDNFRSRKDGEKQERVQNAQAIEKAKMQSFMKDMGLDGTQKITIAPRSD